MAYELRTPLNAIIGFPEIIKPDAIQMKECYLQSAGYIHDAGTLLLNVFNGLLDLARLRAGSVDLEERLVAVGELIQSAVRLRGKRGIGQILRISDDLQRRHRSEPERSCNLARSETNIQVNFEKLLSILFHAMRHLCHISCLTLKN